MTMLRTAWHLVKRLVGSVSAMPLQPHELHEVVDVLLPGEYALFERFGVADQRHALHVLRRFDAFAPQAPVSTRRAALLHDIGKIESSLGTVGRVVATLVGPRTAAFRTYHAHEAHGLQLLQQAGSDTATLALLRGEGDAGLVAALQRADAL